MFEVGHIYRFSYVWHSAARSSGDESGEKYRPCCLVVRSTATPANLYLFAITSQPQAAGSIFLEIPEIECKRAGLRFPARIVLGEYNMTSETELYDFEQLESVGTISGAFMRKIAAKVAEAQKRRALRGVDRRER